MSTDLASQAHFGNYTPASFGWGGAFDPEAHPDLLVPFSYNGVSFGSMHKDVVGLFTALLSELVPLIPEGLIKGQCGCYNPKSVTVGGDRSFHTYGIAVDINWGSNPMANTNPKDPGDLPAATHRIAQKYGCEWGGDWTVPKDWMHIECHLTPQVARTVQEDDMPSAQEVAAEVLKQLREGPLQGPDKDNHSVYTLARMAAQAELGDAVKQINQHIDAVLGRITHDGDHQHPEALVHLKEGIDAILAEVKK